MICWKIALCVLVWAAILDGVTTVESKDPVDRGAMDGLGKMAGSLMGKYGGDMAKIGKNIGGNLLSSALPKEGKAILNTVTSVGKSLAPVLAMAGPIGGAVNSIIGMFSPDPEPPADPRIDKLLEDTAEIKNMVEETKQSINEVKTQLADLKEELQDDIANLGTEMKETMNEMRTEFMAAFGELKDLVTTGFDKLGKQINDQFEGQKAYNVFLQFAVTVDAKLEQFARLVKPAMEQNFADKDQNEKLKLRCITAGYDPLSIISDMYTMAIKNCIENINLPQACLLKEAMVAAKYRTETAALLSNWMEAKIFQLWTYQMVCAGLIHSEPQSLINDNLIFNRTVNETLTGMSTVLLDLVESYWSGTIVEDFVKKLVEDPSDLYKDSNLRYKIYVSCGTALDEQYPLYEHLCIRIASNDTSREFMTIPTNHSLPTTIRLESNERRNEYDLVVVRTPVMDESQAAAKIKSYTDWLRKEIKADQYKGVNNVNELIGYGVHRAVEEGKSVQLTNVKDYLKNTGDDHYHVYGQYFSNKISYAPFWNDETNVNSTCAVARRAQIEKCGKQNAPCYTSAPDCNGCHYRRCSNPNCKACCPETYIGTGKRIINNNTLFAGKYDVPNGVYGCFFVWFDIDSREVFVVHGL